MMLRAANRLFGLLTVLSVMGTLGATVLLIAREVGHWLKFGVWSSVTIQDGLLHMGITVPPSKWVGVQQIVEYALGLSPWVGVLVSGVIVSGLLSSVSSSLEKKQLEEWLKEGHRRRERE
jgi:hypothetical protein